MERFINKKYLGQHFLEDKNIARNIVSLLNVQAGDVIVEIGPGLGALTELLAGTPGRIAAIEVDGAAVARLEERKALLNWENVTILHRNILDFDLTKFSEQQQSRLRLIGNLPYNISTPIMFHIFEHFRCVDDCTFMMQKEVADRIVSPHGSKVYGKLSIFAQVHASISIAFRISPEVFRPKPKVWSAVLTMKMHDRTGEITDFKFFRTLVRQTFSMRRKKISNSLKAMGVSIPSAPEVLRVFFDKRPEDLSVDDFIFMSNELGRSRPTTALNSR
jgi:16S rRNA (adenine1518-N6/adenine1519-N6)-dimethyltransferase